MQPKTKNRYQPFNNVKTSVMTDRIPQEIALEELPNEFSGDRREDHIPLSSENKCIKLC